MIFEIEIKTKKGFVDPQGLHTVSDISGIGIKEFEPGSNDIGGVFLYVSIVKRFVIYTSAKLNVLVLYSYSNVILEYVSAHNVVALTRSVIVSSANTSSSRLVPSESVVLCNSNVRLFTLILIFRMYNEV